MEITHVFSCLVPPGKHSEEPEILRGTQVPKSGALFRMLQDGFGNADRDCKIPIQFRMAADGSQFNEVRNDVIAHVQEPTLETVLILGRRLHLVTTRKSGLGLMFMILGRANGEMKLLISRFPANEGVLAERTGEGLSVEFVEQVFMKNVASYKAALFIGSSFDEHFWDGFVVDKQLSYGPNAAAEYWIRDFLTADFKTTSPAGSRRLAVAMKAAAKEISDLATKQEIVSAITLASHLGGQTVSPGSLYERFGLAEGARKAITRCLGGEHLIEDAFSLDANEFLRHASYRSIELDNGGIMTAPSESFDATFERELINEQGDRYRYYSDGRVVDCRVSSRR